MLITLHPRKQSKIQRAMQIADKYAPQQIESKWYDYWIEQHIFHSEPDQREPYTIDRKSVV